MILNLVLGFAKKEGSLLAENEVSWGFETPAIRRTRSLGG
jgi:hypothetical protein